MANATASSINGPDGFLTEIRNFINGSLSGWTLEVDLAAPPTSEDTAGGRELIVSKGDVLAGFRSTDTGTENLFLFDGNGAYSSMDNIDEMTGNSGIRVSDAEYGTSGLTTARSWNDVPGTWPNVWLFGDNSPSYCHMVAEISTGVYRHMWIGELSPKIGTWTGGAYYAGHYWEQSAPQIDQPDSSSHDVPFDADDNTWPDQRTTVHCETTSPTSSWVELTGVSDRVLNSVQRRAGHAAGVRGNIGCNEFFGTGVSPLSGISMMNPITCFYRDNATNPDSLHHLGFVPDVKFVNMENIDPNTTITVGANTWRVFPLASKNGADAAYNSGLYGLAYRVF